jgi:superfamily I DNA and RNA helicase
MANFDLYKTTDASMNIPSATATRYPLPLIPELIARAQDATLFSKFDVQWGYNNVRIKKQDQWKAVFITNEGLFEPRVMFFGLTNSPATFQMMMNAIFVEELREDWLTIYMDDILVHTPDDPETHRKQVHQVLTKLKNHDIRKNLSSKLSPNICC